MLTKLGLALVRPILVSFLVVSVLYLALSLPGLEVSTTGHVTYIHSSLPAAAALGAQGKNSVLFVVFLDPFFFGWQPPSQGRSSPIPVERFLEISLEIDASALTPAACRILAVLSKDLARVIDAFEERFREEGVVETIVLRAAGGRVLRVLDGVVSYPTLQSFAERLEQVSIASSGCRELSVRVKAGAGYQFVVVLEVDSQTPLFGGATTIGSALQSSMKAGVRRSPPVSPILQSLPVGVEIGYREVVRVLSNPSYLMRAFAALIASIVVLAYDVKANRQTYVELVARLSGWLRLWKRRKGAG